MRAHYECIIIGGGIAGLQAAIQLGRYRRRVLVIDGNDGRSVICRNYHNILGYPDGVSGEQLRHAGREQAIRYDVHFLLDKAVKVENSGPFQVTTAEGSVYTADALLLATGVMDHIPDILHLMPCLGLTVYVCPDCDGYEIYNKRVVVLGAGQTGADLALTLTHWTNDIVYVNHENEKMEEGMKEKLQQHSIVYREGMITEAIVEDEHVFTGVKLQTGEAVYGDRGFIAFGGNEVHTELARQIGVNILENKHIAVDPRTKETNVRNVWAAGDIVAHSEQVTIAMGDGSQAAIWIQKRLLEDIQG